MRKVVRRPVPDGRSAAGRRRGSGWALPSALLGGAVLLAVLGLTALAARDDGSSPSRDAGASAPRDEVVPRSTISLEGPAGPGTLPPGTGLPNEAECAGRVRRSAREPRPRNRVANRTVPPTVSIPGFTPEQGGVDIRARAYADRVTGNFRATTDEIIQWAACKWGFDADVVRAVAAQESSWDQTKAGDVTTDRTRCQPGYTAPCPESFGLLQIKARFHPGTFPWSRDSTAFNLDYALMSRRVCFEGWVTYLSRDPAAGYGPGKEWGCVGFHFSGDWLSEGARRYIERVHLKLDAKPWLERGF